MRRGTSLADRLDTCVTVMRTLALPFPSALHADAKGAEFSAVLPRDMLERRSTGPYSPERIPAEHDRMISRIELRWDGRFEQPDLRIETGGQWPELLILLPHSRVVGRLLMPEAGVPGSDSPWSLTLFSGVTMALQWVAALLRAAGEQDARVAVAYAEDADTLRYRAELPPPHREGYPPVIGVVSVELRRGRGARRQALERAATSIAYSDQRVESLRDGGFTTRLGLVRIDAR